MFNNNMNLKDNNTTEEAEESNQAPENPLQTVL